MNFFNKTKGSISVFLILVLMPMYTCAYLAIDTARYSAAKSKINGALELSGNAALADYDETLRELYGVFAMSQTEEDLTSNLSSYFGAMIDSSGIPDLEPSFATALITSVIRKDLSESRSANKDLFQSAIATQTESFSASYDNESSLVNIDVLEKEILEFMKYRAPYNWATTTKQKLSAFTNLDKVSDIFKKSSEYLEEFSKCEDILGGISKELKDTEGGKSSNTTEILNGILKELPELSGKLNDAQGKAKKWNDSISELDSGDLKTLLSGEYKDATSGITDESIKSFSNAIKKDIETAKTNSGANAPVELTFVHEPFYSYLTSRFAKESAEKASSSSETDAMNDLAKTDIESLYSTFDDIFFSNLIPKEIKNAIWEEIQEQEDESINESGINKDISTDTFSSVSTLLKSLGNGTKAVAYNCFEVEYITEMFSCFTTTATDQNLLGYKYATGPAFGGECEYIIFGRNCKASNMTCSTNLLLCIRLLLNSLYAFTNSQMRQTALAAGAAVAGWSGIGVSAAQNLFLLTWAMAESILDVASLCKGETVPIYKSAATWSTGLQNVARTVAAGAGNYVCRSIDDVFSSINGAAEDELEKVVDSALSYMDRTATGAVESLTSMITTPIENKLTEILTYAPDVYTKEDIANLITKAVNDKDNGSEGYKLAKETFFKYGLPFVTDEIYEDLPNSFSSDASVASAASGLIEDAVADVYEDLFSRLEEIVYSEQSALKEELRKLSGYASNEVKEKALSVIKNYSGRLSAFLGDATDGGENSVSTFTGVGMNYKEYLKLFAAITLSVKSGKENMLRRCATVMQINCSRKNEDFDIRNCYTKVLLSSKTRIDKHVIVREEAYEY